MTQPPPENTENLQPDATTSEEPAAVPQETARPDAPEPAAEAPAPDDAPSAEPAPAAPEPAAEAPAPDEEPSAEPAPATPTAEGEAPAEPGKPEDGRPSEPPALGPVIVGVAEEPKPRRAAPQRERPQRPRRRRLSAAEKHRRAFFARLSELRRAALAGEDNGPDEPETPSAEAEAEAPAQEAPAEEQPAAEQPEAPAEQQPAAEQPEAPADEQPAADAAPPRQQQRSGPPPPVDRPRLLAAIDRVGGPEAVREALKPQQDEQGKPLKWAASCCEAARGAKPGDPAYTAWLRLAATPVREVKGLVDDRPADDRRGGRGRGGGRRDGGGGGRPQRDGDRGRGRGPRPERANREDLATHGRDEAFRPSVRIVTAEDPKTRREREKAEKAEREAKRQAARERLSKFGY